MTHINSELLKQKIARSPFSQRDLVHLMQINDTKISSILHKRLYPRLAEIYMLSLLLNLTDDDIVDIFFSDLELD